MDKVLGGIALFIGIVIIWSCLLALPVWLLWNWLMPVIFGLGKIGFLQSLGLNLLCGCLFKSNVTVNK
jgi:hypothetical protein